jgi:capsular exopolysaccharide synthesis family protein
MELSRYLDILRRRLLIILLATFAAVAVVAAAGYMTPPVYRAYATIRVLEDTGIQDFNIFYDNYGARLINTYGLLLTSSPMLKEAMAQVGVTIPLDELRKEVKTETVPDTELMSVSVANQDPRIAQALTNQLAALLVEHVRSLYTGDNASSNQIKERLANLESEIEQDRQKLGTLMQDYSQPESEIEILKSTIQFKEDSYRNMLLLYNSTQLNEDLRARSVMVVTPAALPVEPENQYGLQEVGLGLLIGVFSGLALALALENMDTRIHSYQQLEGLTHLPLLGVVPRGILSLKSCNGNDLNRLQEEYRLLVINLQKLREKESIQTVMISSAVDREGKSTVAANLSQVLAERGQTVFLIEADMRRPSLAQKLGGTGDPIPTAAGLSDLLSMPGALFDEQKLCQVLSLTDQPTLFFIESGSAVANPTALLSSPRMDQLLNFLGSQGQTTLIDTPPILGMADVSVVASKVDGIVLVISQGVSRREEISAAIRQLQAAKSHILGLIFIKKSATRGYYY